MKDNPMQPLPQPLLSFALRVVLEHEFDTPAEGVQPILAHQAPGYRAEQYAEALERAKELNSVTGRMVNASHAAKGPEPKPNELAKLCPGFSTTDYLDVIQHHTWTKPKKGRKPFRDSRNL